MSKLVVFSFENGDLHYGYPTVTARLREEGDPHYMKIKGSLPAAPELLELYRNWRLLYLALYQRLELNSRIEIIGGDVTNVSAVDFKDVCQQLLSKFNHWLKSESFLPIERALRTQLDQTEEIRVIIETDDRLLQQLPWHLWDFCTAYPKAEIALSASEYRRTRRQPTRTHKAKVRILAIFGNSKGINLEKDRAILEKLSEQAEIKFLVEPQLDILYEYLWQDEGWDILFFAGHSSSQEKGTLQLNKTDSLTLDQLKYALQKAIGRGLKLAIFNSCDGLGLARDLAELDIPQVIVMREPITDAVAHKFLRDFLWAFSRGQTLYAAVRDARKKLQELEGKCPCATWLPVICQNPAEALTNWQDWCVPPKDNSTAHKFKQKQPHRQISLAQDRLGRVLLASMAIASLVMGVRQLGILETWELQAFDRSLRLRPNEGLDPRLLIVEVTDNDVRQQQLKEMRSLSDTALARLLEKLRPYQPRVIGLDIYRDFRVNPNQAKLVNYLRDDRLIAICEVERAKNDYPGKDDYPGIDSPPEIPKNRLGFSDLPVDGDRVIRRQILFMDVNPQSACATNESFSFRLARLYLDAEKGIRPQRTERGNWQLGNVIFGRLESNSGGYRQLDAQGYQMLLNYRAADPVAKQVTLSDILNGSLDAKLSTLVKGRIVLIGTTAESFKDYHFTPYSTDSGSKVMPGVTIHAHMVSQILSAVLNDRPLLWWLPLWAETLWVWGWSLVGGVLGWRSHSLLQLGLASATAVGILSGFCFVLLLRGGWLPLVPAAIAGAIALLVTYKVTQTERKS